jgi:hypothetical protein
MADGKQTQRETLNIQHPTLNAQHQTEDRLVGLGPPFMALALNLVTRHSLPVTPHGFSATTFPLRHK